MKEPIAPQDYTHPKAAEITGDSGGVATLQYKYDDGRVFTINGEYSGLLADVELNKNRPEPRTARVRRVSAPVAQVAITEPKSPETPVYAFPSPKEKLATWFADGKLRKFDKQHETNLYAEKQELRRRQAIFLMAGEAGLFDRSSDYYKSQLRRLAK